MPTIRPYTPADHADLIGLMTQLQDHIGSIDPLLLNKRAAEFDAEAYCKRMLERVAQHRGLVLIAEENGPVGFVGGIIEAQEPHDLIDHFPVTEGTVLELVVDSGQRSKGTGAALLEAMESYFKEKGCAYVRTICFTPNEGAHRFYEKNGYHDRYVGMIKNI